MAMQFEWDEEKAETNLKKHKVSYEEAKTIFGDPLSITVDDPDHSKEEPHYIDIGKSSSGKLLVVVYTERGNKTRIISCRRATRMERKQYEEQF